jgi:hypothetical protein
MTTNLYRTMTTIRNSILVQILSLITIMTRRLNRTCIPTLNRNQGPNLIRNQIPNLIRNQIPNQSRFRAAISG